MSKYRESDPYTEELQGDCLDVSNLDCDDSGAVTRIYLSRYNVIPDAIQALSRLQHLHWSESEAREVPTVIATLASLTRIDMLRCLASGSLPSTISALSKLK
ncbi:hypothetical protein CLOM_g11130 [Closterium sp. NIES-68]|nr:hypothetical protein CLOM_g11130 [Closterium sp. NIES-68]GJP75262.1 hypothetical protein CLOP_g5719 [Closterium sp. NIES-67]